MNNQSKVVRLNNVPVIFSNLDKPDVFFGEPGHHSVTIPVDGIVKAEINKVHAEFGSKNIAGLRTTEENGEQIQFKTNVYTKDGKKRFPRQFDRKKLQLEEQPERGDVINLMLMAKSFEKSGSSYTCFYLDAIQLVERNSSVEVPFDSLDKEEEELFPELSKAQAVIKEKKEQATKKKDDDVDLPWE